MTTASHRYLTRISLKGALIVCLPLTGFIWALPNQGPMMAAAVVLTLITIAVGIGAEFMASSTEIELRDLAEQMASNRRKRGEELGLRDEKLRQFDRVVQLLTEQNHGLRAKLLAVHSELQRRREEAATEVASVEEMLPQRRNAFGSRGL